MASDRHIGRVLDGKYRLLALLGEGGMGRVYRALQLPLRREVAVKLITGNAPHPPEWVQRFKREAKATSALSHPNSVRLFDFGVTEEHELYMVMELLEGTDLARHLGEHGRLALPFALQVTREVLLALSEAHALGIVHRDIKPDNVFLARVHDGRIIAKVMDFGIAGIERPRTHDKLTRTGIALGTPAYMSPEQAQGQPVDGRSDLYSLGVMLFELLTGEQPFRASGTVPLLVAHVTQPPRRLSDTGVQLTYQERVQALLDAWLAKEPQHRPSIARAIAAVERLSADALRTSLAPQPAPAQSVAAPPARDRSSDPSLGATGSLRGYLRARRTPGLLVLAAVLAGAAVLVYAARHAPVAAISARYQQLRAAVSSGPEVYRVRIISVPSGARILRDGTELATTPHTFVYRTATDLTLARHGYERQTLHLTASTAPLVTVKLVRDLGQPAPAERVTDAEGEPANAASDSRADQSSETSRSSATDTPPAPEDVPDWSAPLTPEEVGPREGDPSQRAVRHAVARFFGRLFIQPPDRAELEALLRRPLPYPNVRSATRAYDAGVIDRAGFREAIWVLRERRRQRTEATDARYARGAITREEHRRQHDLISLEFWGD